MTYETVFGRDRYDKSFGAKTRIPLGFDRRELRIETRKDGSRGGIYTSAAVVQMYEDGSGFTHAFGLAGGGDFRQTLERADVRCTEKSVRALHELAMLRVEDVLQAAIAHYSKSVTA